MRVRTRISAAFGTAAVAGALAAAPAVAHPGHETCREFGNGTAAIAGEQGGDFGAAISGIARSGAAQETVTIFHETGCEHE